MTETTQPKAASAAARILATADSLLTEIDAIEGDMASLSKRLHELRGKLFVFTLDAKSAAGSALTQVGDV